MMGCGFGEGEQGYNIGRNAGLLAGIDHHVPATTVNRFCASSLQTLRMAFHAVQAGEGDQCIASGVEAVSRAGGGANFQFHPQLDGSENSLYNVYIPMGLTAENVAERCGVSREAQDEWAVVSQNRAVDAQSPATSTARSSPSRRRRRPRPTRRAMRSRSRPPRWRRTTAPARARRWRSCPSSPRPSRRTGP